jgi:hypothetical protein
MVAREMGSSACGSRLHSKPATCQGRFANGSVTGRVWLRGTALRRRADGSHNC